MRIKRLQIALEFMIIFAFVLVVFLFIFALVANQRVQTLNSQIFSQEQLIAQSVVAQLNTALQSGNGYTAHVPLVGTVGTLSYHLLITKNGGVIVNATAGTQALQAFAFSTVRNVLSNNAYIQANTFYYNLPITNGTLYIQNSYGTICIDYTCPNVSAQASNISLSSQVVHAGQFSGTTYVKVSTYTPPTGAVTVSVWVYPTSFAENARVVDNWQQSASADWLMYVSTSGQVTWYVQNCGNQGPSTASLPLNTWSHLVGVVSSSGDTLYVNGVDVSTGAGCTVQTSTTYLEMGGAPDDTGSSFFTGEISNVQVYNKALSATSVNALYQEGISGSPVVPANVVGWWPLNGDTKDYSGSGYNGNVLGGSILFTSVAQLSAKVSDPQGYPVPRTLVGFETTLGTFGTKQWATNLTNANGIATAFLTQQGNSGQAVVRATAYNGNTALQGNLVGWWPLGLGQSTNAFDLSGNGNAGTFNGFTDWTSPNYVAAFDGSTAFVSLPTVAAPSTQTVSAWVYTSSIPGREEIFNLAGDFLNVQNGNACFYILGINSAYICSSTTLTPNRWYLVSATFDGAKETLYINGVASSILTISGTASGGTYGSIGDCYYCGNKDFFGGDIANVQFYSTALSANQVFQTYIQGISAPPVTSGSVVGWWPLNGDTMDYSGSGNNGTVNGNFNFVSSPINKSISNNATSLLSASFNGGLNSYVATGNALSLQPTSSITVSAWVKPSTSSINYPMVFTDSGSGGTSGYNLYIYPTGGAASFIVLENGGSWGGCWALGTANIITNSWYLETGVYNGTNIRVYVDGVPQATSSCANTGINYGSTPTSLIGWRIEHGANDVYNGLISNVQVYNSSLTRTQVVQLYNEGIMGLPLNNTNTNYKLAAWYPLDGNSNDYSGQGNNGTATNVQYVQQRATLPGLPAPFAGTGINLNGQNSYVGLGFNLGGYLYINGGNTNPNELCLYVSSWVCAGHLSANAWQYVVASNNHSSNKLTFYINGASVGSFASQGTPSNTYAAWIYPINTVGQQAIIDKDDNGVNSEIGIRNGASDLNAFNGSISDAQVYNAALTSGQILQLYNAQAPPAVSTVIPLSWLP